MGTGRIALSGQVTGIPSGSKTIGPFTIVLPNAIGAISDLPLVSGANGPYAIPALATYVLIVPPPTNLSVLTLKGSDAGDTGVPINGQNPSLLSLDPTATALNINSSLPVPSGFELSFF